MTKKKQTNKKKTTNRREAATGMRATGILSYFLFFCWPFPVASIPVSQKKECGMWRQEKNERQESDFPVAHFPVANFPYKS